MSNSSIIGRTWIVVSVILNSISLINLQKDLLPALVKWNDFFINIFDNYHAAISILFTPARFVVRTLFHVTIPSPLMHYIVMALLVTGTLVRTLKTINHPGTPYVHITIYLLLFWPLVFFTFLVAETFNLILKLRKLTIGELIFIKYIGSVIFVAVFISFVNYALSPNS
jgi:hypothetical protein